MKKVMTRIAEHQSARCLRISWAAACKGPLHEPDRHFHPHRFDLRVCPAPAVGSAEPQVGFRRGSRRLQGPIRLAALRPGSRLSGGAHPVRLDFLKCCPGGDPGLLVGRRLRLSGRRSQISGPRTDSVRSDLRRRSLDRPLHPRRSLSGLHCFRDRGALRVQPDEPQDLSGGRSQGPGCLRPA